MLSLVKKYFLPVFIGILLGILFMYLIISRPITHHLANINHLEYELNDYNNKLVIYEDRFEAMKYFNEVTDKYLTIDENFRIEPFSLDNLSDEEIDKLLEYKYFKLNGDNLVYSSSLDDDYYYQYLAESSPSWDCIVDNDENDLLLFFNKLRYKIKDLLDFSSFIEFINCD